jgi:chemotaxis protein CheD
VKRFWEPRNAIWQVHVLPGELYVTRADEMITTVLGSCVSACVRDRERAVGGINHFLLPRAPMVPDDGGATARYGVYALECLVNAVLRGGGSREALEVKVFGGGRVIEGSGDIGRANIDFVRGFFAKERISIVAHDVGGTVARRLRYWPQTGRVQLLQMPMIIASQVVADEQAAAARLAPTAGSVELF